MSRRHRRAQSTGPEVLLDAVIAGVVRPGCEWPSERCPSDPNFNLTCVHCGSSLDLCNRHTSQVMRATEAGCDRCGTAGQPRTVLQVREIRGI